MGEVRPISGLPRGTPLLLHSCCGPCSTAVIERLGQDFALTVYFYNPNIDDRAEYEKRLGAQEQTIAQSVTAYPIAFVQGPYDVERFLALAQGKEAAPEGGARCGLCFDLRLQSSAQLAKKLEIAHFTTTLTVSPHKNASLLHEKGQSAAMAYGVTYLAMDFKENGGYQRSVFLSKQMDLYRQNFCACSFSKRK